MSLKLNNFSIDYSNNLIYRRLVEDKKDYQYVIHPGIILNTSSGYIWEKIGYDIDFDTLIKDISSDFDCNIDSKITEQVLGVLKYFANKKFVQIKELSSNSLIENTKENIDRIFDTDISITINYKNEKFVPITDVDLLVTRGCNFSCKHCFVSCSIEERKNDKIDIAQWKKIIDNLCDLGLNLANITGGEPFTYPDLMELLEYLDSKKIDIFLLTNGFLLNEEIIKKLTSFRKIRVQISVDGASLEIHDMMRNTKNSLDRICENIMLLRKYNIQVTMATTLSKYNYDEIISGKLIELANRLKVNVFGVSPCLVKVGRAIENWDISPTVEQSLKVIEYLLDEQKKGHPFRISIGAPPIFTGVKTTDELQPYLPKCRRGINSCSITSDGLMAVCTDFIEVDYDVYKLGNVLTDSIEHIWKNANHVREERLSSVYNVKGVCSICIYKKRCGGSCRADAYSTYKDINAPYPFCQHLYENGQFPQNKIDSTAQYIEFGNIK